MFDLRIRNGSDATPLLTYRISMFSYGEIKTNPEVLQLASVLISDHIDNLFSCVFMLEHLSSRLVELL